MISIQPIHKYDCDVVIVGGGPAGSSLAYHLAKQGIRVKVIEAEKFPRDKTCGDAVSRVALQELKEMGITDLTAFANANVVNDVALFIEEEIISVGLSKPKDEMLRGRVIPRYLLDNWIYEAAKNEGAIYLENTRLASYKVNDNCVIATVKNKEGEKFIKAKMIVGADGSNSTVARQMHGTKADERYQLLGLRTYYEGVSGPVDRCDIYFSKENFPGLFWFFPTGDGKANVGSAMISTTLPQNDKHARTLLANQIEGNKFLKERIGNGKMKGKINGWPLTFQSPKHTVVSERIILVGDAAGLINPLSGDGIQYALLSGRWAAETITNCVKENDFSFQALSAYKQTLQKEMAYDMAVSNLMIKITRNRTFTNLWMEVLKIVFERAKVDKEYAAVIAGIFDGTLPSYKALSPSFLLKSVLQGGLYAGTATANNIMQGPASWQQKASEASTMISLMLQNIKAHPKEQVSWLAGIAKTGIDVSGHIINHIRNAK